MSAHMAHQDWERPPDPERSSAGRQARKPHPGRLAIRRDLT